jgi:microcystin-dependent protein
MANPFVGEIRIVGFNFPPNGWAFCNGQLMPISQNTALFSLLGTFYGGDGKSNFALPNLQGMAAINQGSGPGLSQRDIGETGGEAHVTLLQTEIPQHTHNVSASSAGGDVNNPAANTVWAKAHLGKTPFNMYNPSAGTGVAMSGQAFATAGSSLPHNNMPPFLTLNFVIALQGVFPARQ